MITAPGIDHQEWACRFAVLSDPSRLALLIAMHADPNQPVLHLAANAAITPNAASQALRGLREQGWVHSERDGREIRYRLNPDAIVHRILHDIIGAHHH